MPSRVGEPVPSNGIDTPQSDPQLPVSLGRGRVFFRYETEIETAYTEFPGSPLFKVPSLLGDKWYEYRGNGGKKTEHYIELRVSDCRIMADIRHIGKSVLERRERYRRPLGLTITIGRWREIDSDFSSGRSLKAFSDDLGSSCRVRMQGDEAAPVEPLFAPPLPGITYAFDATFSKNPRVLRWSVEHDRYPSHRVTSSWGRLFEFSHITHGTTIGSLYPNAPNHTDQGTVP